ncbi:MAG: hypothetical protein GYA24_18550 [Candidatus Lokiarchaeota archaeon]|nr:hypothetical protein [Candidatus Lokiarchaeota archaeon]
MAAMRTGAVRCRYCNEAATTHPSGYCEACFFIIEETHGEFTCRGCKDATTCEWAWDIYSTAGDCLRDK